ncbi:S8 family serine peptidase [Pseudomonas sp. BP8]|uniref:S8 family serine peptidase n=1 Tax=Pseudomonas sp. BP8 TaxID=2817864 RepID=UPI001AE1AD41|nr:S8 family serine peptidase [Pseudomonas sp. BP8]MBP2262734.1 hypothetical protein [Pseudomonas sp. BP8]HDS1734243.1 S8 family serine peptidase [Pseudomonas putida]
MPIDVSFIYFRNFRFDGKFHIRCTGNDLHKVRSIRYELKRTGPDGLQQLDAVRAKSHARTGSLADYGCPATLSCDEQPGTYSIHPVIRLTDKEIIALDLPSDVDGLIRPPALTLEIGPEESNRSVLDKVPLYGATGRRKRAVQRASDEAFPLVGEGERYPPLVLKFTTDGYQRLREELEPGSNSLLVRRWPKLNQVLQLQPFLDPQERGNAALSALSDYYCLIQPDSMLNDTFIALLQTLSALDYIESIEFATPPVDTPNPLLIGAAILATLLTGAIVKAGNNANENARPTPDFEALQAYLDEPGRRYRGMNIRKVWQQQATGKGARVHFSDAGLYPEHEELRSHPNLKIVGLEPNTDPEHGTASLGILMAKANGFGVTGICHEAEVYFYNSEAHDSHGYPQTLKNMLANVKAGDIVAINRQTANINVLGTFLPTVHQQAWWDAIQALTQRGAVVVAAACNGTGVSDPKVGTHRGYGVDLSHCSFFEDHGDAGAILIGACQSWDGKPHQYSNHSYRYRMLNAWGDSVVTLGYGALQHKPDHVRDYTDNYAGTSSATPLVAGALSLIQSYAMEQHHVYLNANQLHLLVMQSGYQDATLPDTQVLPMGNRPNVHAAMVLLDQILGGGRFHPRRDEL